MYKRNIKPIAEFIEKSPPQECTVSTADSENCTIVQKMSPAPSVQGRTGTDQRCLSRCIVIGKIWKSRQNGMVYDPQGLAPTICCGHHAGVEPKIIVYE